MSNFTATTRQVLDHLGLNDTKTLHRRREDYWDKSNRIKPEHRIFKLGVHYTKKSPNSKLILWDLDKAVNAWTAATRVLSMATLQSQAEAQVREELEGRA